MADKISIGVIGDFSGWGEIPDSQKDLSKCAFLDIDRDCINDLFRKMSPEVLLGLPFCRLIRLTSMDHFHPDEMINNIPSISRLFEASENLDNPKMMRRMISESGADPGITEDPPPKGESNDAPTVSGSNADLLDCLLGDDSDEASQEKTRLDPSHGAPSPKKSQAFSEDPVFRKLLNEIAESSADHTDYKQQGQWEQAINRELSLRVSSILHNPEFQRLESIWRSVENYLVKSDFSDMARIRILNFSRKDLADELELNQHESLPIINNLINNDPGSEPFKLLIGAYTFEATIEDLMILDQISKIAMQSNAVFVAAAGKSLTSLTIDSDQDLYERWEALRKTPHAGHIHLACPLVLLRLPYGADTDQIERFEYNEYVDPSKIDDYLWGNPAFCVASAMARASISEISPAQAAKLANIPLHVYKSEDGIGQTGPMEHLITDVEIQNLSEKGFVPVAGIRGTDSAMICSFNSISGTPVISL